MDLTGKRALITGGAAGIGKSIAEVFAKAGAEVIVNYRTRMPETGTAIQADVAVASDVVRLAEQAGHIDILVNNAGMIRPELIENITEQSWDEVVDWNLKSVFLVTQAFLPGMRERRFGRIINLSSVAAQVGGLVGPHYAAAKAGIIGMTHSYASLLSKEGITVNAIAPALIDTDMVRSNPRARPDIIPVGRFGTVEEVSDAALMLACNGYITGQTININGGWYMS
jgi:3-oxoacyl-[acyl-carrier protein] reductase